MYISANPRIGKLYVYGPKEEEMEVVWQQGEKAA